MEESSSAQLLAEAEADCRLEAVLGAGAVLGARLQELYDEQEEQHSALAQANADLETSLAGLRVLLAEEHASLAAHRALEGSIAQSVAMRETLELYRIMRDENGRPPGGG